MPAIADTRVLVEDGVISPDQAAEILARSRSVMMSMAINAILTGGIVAATGGLIFWLADALAVACVGLVALFLGYLILRKGSGQFRMFGTAATLIGAGLLIGGAGVELVLNFEELASGTMILAGGLIAAAAAYTYRNARHENAFVIGALTAMGIGLHFAGFLHLFERHEISGITTSGFNFYAAALLICVGWFLDVRLVTALAIVPFAQILDTGVFYQHAIYAFYSPESTLTILQMVALIALCLWAARTRDMRHARHALILAVMAFIVANLSALVGSLWGDYVGESIWGPDRRTSSQSYDDWIEHRDAFRATAIYIHETVFSIVWAAALLGVVAWAAHVHNRGLFYAGLTFGGIHAYTQMFEEFGDEPLAFVIGGLAAIPLAWGMWRLNTLFTKVADGPEGTRV